MASSGALTAPASDIAARRDGLRWRLPFLGLLGAAILIASRRPDAITHAQFWAEDGRLYYANVYNHGLLATLLVPQAGCFEVLPTLAVGIAQNVPLAFAPLVTNTLAILIRGLPVGLLLSTRAERITPDIRVRALLAGLYIALPGAAETDANIVNAMWYLAVAAVIIVMLRPPEHRFARILDATIIALSALTSVFCIVLAPLAFLYRRWRGDAAVPRSTLAILMAGALIQLLAIFVLEYHLPSGYGATPRPAGHLHATVPGFFQILGYRVIGESLLGNTLALSSTVAVLLGVLGSIGIATAFRRAGAELRLMIAFGAALFMMALARPLSSNWPGLLNATDGGRYFVIPQFAFIATLVWALGYRRRNIWLVVPVGVLLCACAVTIPREWTYSPLEDTRFASRASLFEHQKAGTRMTFELQPRDWSMTLVKH